MAPDAPARPLTGLRVAVTRPRAQASGLAAGLAEHGAEVVVAPLIEIRPAPDRRVWKQVARDVQRADWVVVTSANGAEALRELAPLLRGADGPRVAAVGPATAAALRELGLEPAFLPERFAAAEIAAGLGDLVGARVLVLQSDLASRELAGDLAARGAVVDRAIAYATAEAVPPRPELDELARGVDAVLLASGSAARSLAALAEELPAVREALVVCIGPKTATVAREAGLPVGLVADEATNEGMIQALVTHFGKSE